MAGTSQPWEAEDVSDREGLRLLMLLMIRSIVGAEIFFPT